MKATEVLITGCLLCLLSLVAKAWLPGQLTAVPRTRYLILGVEDGNSTVFINYAGYHNWRIEQSRRALSDNKGLYEFILGRPFITSETAAVQSEIEWMLGCASEAKCTLPDYMKVGR